MAPSPNGDSVLVTDGAALRSESSHSARASDEAAPRSISAVHTAERSVSTSTFSATATDFDEGGWTAFREGAGGGRWRRALPDARSRVHLRLPGGENASSRPNSTWKSSRRLLPSLGSIPRRRRTVARHIGGSLIKAMEIALGTGPPEAAELVAAECIVLAETKGHLIGS